MKKVTLLLILLSVVLVAAPALAFEFGMHTTQGSITPGGIGTAQSGTLAGVVGFGFGDEGGVTGNANAAVLLNEGAGMITPVGDQASAATQTATSVNTTTAGGGVLPTNGFIAAGSLAVTNTVGFVNGTLGPAASSVRWHLDVF